MKTLELESLSLLELKVEDAKSINGGGWLADLIADTIAYYKCGCGPKFSSVDWSSAARIN
ncbi:MAG: hypothetical protein KA713_16680 [Chryseotalea sp. WA131a]|nr:MAG: hypothetical protein KA713_16680 [Chryseotalea sp. WA131a]